MALEKAERWLTTGRLTRTAPAAPLVSPVTLLRIAIILARARDWEFARRIPACSIATSCLRCLPSAGALDLLSHGDYYFNLGVTAGEIGDGAR